MNFSRHLDPHQLKSGSLQFSKFKCDGMDKACIDSRDLLHLLFSGMIKIIRKDNGIISKSKLMVCTHTRMVNDYHSEHKDHTCFFW
jgi:hypothetical protein